MPGGGFTLDDPTLDTINGGSLADGQHTIQFVAEDELGHVSEAISFTFIKDTIAPSFTELSIAEGATLTPSSELSGILDNTGAGTGILRYRFDGGLQTPVSVNSSGQFNRTPLAVGISDGSHNLTIEGIDAAGNSTSVMFGVTVARDGDPFVVTHHTPAQSTDEVGVTFRPQIFFSNVVDATTLTDASFFASFSGEKIPATIVPANDGSFAWLFFSQQLPLAANIEVTMVGDSVRNLAGDLLDGDGDGIEGGDLVFSFSTVSLQPLLGTSLTGIVMDPGADLQPHTEDDAPLAGVEVFLLGLEDNIRITDETGRFTFESVPGGNIKVDVNGMTATGPGGVYFPSMVMDSHTVAGATNFVMGMEEIFLPRLQTSILKDIDVSQTNMVVAEEASAPDLTPQQRSHLMVEVPADSLVGPDGSRLSSGQVGISTVPPELVRDMLPPGILQHTFDITVQAPGISNFSQPAPLTIPNMVGALPGEQINLLSFDHTTGRLVIEGTMTVSEDGMSVTTDPGTGITHPGWHGGTRTGSRIIPGDPIEEGDEESSITATGTSTFFTGGGQESTIMIAHNRHTGTAYVGQRHRGLDWHRRVCTWPGRHANVQLGSRRERHAGAADGRSDSGRPAAIQ